MGPVFAAMREDVGVGATGVLQGVAEDGHFVEAAFVVDRLSDGPDGKGRPRQSRLACSESDSSARAMFSIIAIAGNASRMSASSSG